MVYTSKTVGIVAEYNPFHNGHAYHIQKAKEKTGAQHVVVVMSGNYVQRGEPAIVNKQVRTRMALAHGVDVVLELPLCFATSSAEYFAKAAVQLLAASGIVQDICFGSECGDMETLQRSCDVLVHEDKDFKVKLQQNLATGMSFPAARGLAMGDLRLQTPNDILAVEYLKAMRGLPIDMQAHTITRAEAGYHETVIQKDIASATAIRQEILHGDLQQVAKAMPLDAFQLLHDEIASGMAPTVLDDLSTIFHYLIHRKDATWARGILDITEGLEHRMYEAAGTAFLLSAVRDAIKTKRYTYTKIQRALLHFVLEIERAWFAQEQAFGPRYIRVLGFRRASQFLLTEMECHAQLPLLMNLKNAKNVFNDAAMMLLEKEVFADDLYYGTHSAIAKNYAYRLPLVIV